MAESNIWADQTFGDWKQKSSFHLLREQSKYLINATKGELKMDITAADGYTDENPPRLAVIYTMYVVAPRLGNFRRRILTVAEYVNDGHYPVDIIVNIDNNDKIKNVTEERFIETVQNILNRHVVRSSLQNLFIQSKEVERSRNIQQFVFTKKEDVFNFDGKGAFEGDFLSTNKSFDIRHRTNKLSYFINEIEYLVVRKLSNVNPYATEFEVYEDEPFTLHFEGFDNDERIVMNYKIVDPPTFF